MSPSGPAPLPVLLAAPVTLLLAAGCEAAPAPAPEWLEGEGEGGAAWISGTVDERFQQVGDQLAGFSSTMFEVAHRYRELHWAVKDGNWPYADYQVEKIAGPVERGIVRRPARAASARDLFLGTPVDDLRSALHEGDEEAVVGAFQEFTAACNQCHVAEDMAFVVVGAPEARSTVVVPSGSRE
jgi:hypothetical protein